MIKYIDPKQLIYDSIYFGSWYQRKNSLSWWCGMAASGRQSGMRRKLRDHISNHMYTENREREQEGLEVINFHSPCSVMHLLQ